MRPIEPSRDHYLDAALARLPRLLQLLDRDPTSPTYGCFDRQYWHYRALDFPCGMAQEFGLPLALAHALESPRNPWTGEPRLAEWALAAIDFAARSAHADGSCDDYYPFERALGATVFSLYAMAETLHILGPDHLDASRREFLLRRARWVAHNGESGVLSNHHAIAAASLAATARLVDAPDLLAAARKKVRETLAHQDPEGWFLEYEGFDPGYQTVTVDYLARYWRMTGEDELLEPLERAVHVLERVQHPDGTFGGEYAARNTRHTQPHGFELLAPHLPAAGRIADRYLEGLARGHVASNDDDRLLAHPIYPWFMAWRDHASRATPTPSRPDPEATLLPGAGFWIDRGADDFLIAGGKKGAPFRIWKKEGLVANDSGPFLRLEDGTRLVAHLAHDAAVERIENGIRVRTRFHAAKGERMTPVKNLILRTGMLTVGRWFRTLVRKALQRRLILGRAPAPFTLERTLERTASGFRVEDRIARTGSGPRVVALRMGVGQTSIYIAASQPWEAGWLLPWTDLDARAPELERAGEVTIVREF